MDTGPIVKVFDSLLTAGAAVGFAATAFFVMLAGYQYMSAGGSVRAVESAKGSLYNALIGFAVIILCKIHRGPRRQRSGCSWCERGDDWRGAWADELGVVAARLATHIRRTSNASRL